MRFELNGYERIGNDGKTKFVSFGEDLRRQMVGHLASYGNCLKHTEEIVEAYECFI